jgi:hypothetical protein
MHFTPWTEPYGFHTLVLSEEGRRWQDTARHAEGGDDYQAYLRHNLAESASAETAGALDDLRSTLEAWLTATGDKSGPDGAGRLRLDPAERGWSPRPPIRTGLGLRPY